MFKTFLSAVGELLYPSVCRCCGRILTDSELYLCGDCLMNFPLTMQSDYPKEMNFMRKKFEGYEIENCCCYFVYDKEDRYGNIVKEIKFGNDRKLGTYMGNLFGNLIADGEEFTDIDVVVPIPLHKLRKRKRGYNQSEVIASPIADKLGVPLCTCAVKRVRNTSPQSRMSSDKDRKDNMRGAFTVTKADLIDGKHIMVFDDVTTTGETIKAFIRCVKKACPDTKVSVTTLSATK